MNWNKIWKIPDAFKKITNKVYHFDAGGAEAPYIVWGEDGSTDEFNADNKLESRLITGTVDYFTKNTEDSNLEKIEDAMESIGMIYHLNSVQYEDNAGIVHYEWTWKHGQSRTNRN